MGNGGNNVPAAKRVRKPSAAAVQAAAAAAVQRQMAAQQQAPAGGQRRGRRPTVAGRLGEAAIRRTGAPARTAKRFAGPTAVGVSNVGGRAVTFTPTTASEHAVLKIAIAESASAILSTSQLQSISGGDLEVIAAIYAAKMENWNVVDAKRQLQLSEKLISGQYADPTNTIAMNLGINRRAKTLVVKSRLPLIYFKRWGLGMAPPYGPPSNPLAFAGTAATNVLQPNNSHIDAIKEIAEILGQYNRTKPKLNWRVHVVNSPAARAAAAAEAALSNRENAANEGIVSKKATGKGIFFVEGDLEADELDKIQVVWPPGDTRPPRPADVKTWVECKVGDGKYEGIPGEALQLIKAGWTTLLLWHREQLRLHGADISQWKPPPKINLVFLSWFHGVQSQMTQNQMYNVAQEFMPISDTLQNRLNALARERFGMTDPAYGEPFTVIKASPRNIEALTLCFEAKL